jgi:uncharacterized protein (DUF1501 family)
MAITRRQFLKHGGAAAAGALLGPRIFGSPFINDALAAIGNRYFIVLFLDGGNDGLNTVVPVDGTLRGWYEDARDADSTAGGIRVSTTHLVGTPIGLNPGPGPANNLALHPGFRAPGTAGDGGLWKIFDDDDCAVIQGCGYPEYSLSHEESRVIWQNADPFLQAYAGSGWVGRHISAPPGYTGIPGVNINDSIATEFRNPGASVLAVRELRRFGFPYDDVTEYRDQVPKDVVFTALHDAAIAASGFAGFQHVGDTGKTTLISTNAYPQLHDDYVADRATFDARYTQQDGAGTSAARDLREIAKVIYGTESAAVASRFFWLGNGGYDTHSDQGAGETDGQHYSLHREIGRALKIFRDDLVDMGVWDRTCVLVYSEFSRRVIQNDNGTDHGSQGPMFLMGGKINGGVYGSHPNIEDGALDGEGNTVYHQNNDGFRSTDFRDVYGAVLKHWMGMSQASILAPVGGILKLDTDTPASEYWTAANFDFLHPLNGLALFQP